MRFSSCTPRSWTSRSGPNAPPSNWASGPIWSRRRSGTASWRRRSAPRGQHSRDHGGPVMTNPTVPGGDGKTTSAGGYTSVDSPAEKPEGTTSDASAKGGDESSALAERSLHDPTPSVTATGVQRTGMFGVHGSGDTSGYGLLVLEAHTPVPAERPYGGYFDEVADALIAAMAARSIPPQALLQTTVANKEITFYIARDYVTQFL